MLYILIYLRMSVCVCVCVPACVYIFLRSTYMPGDTGSTATIPAVVLFSLVVPKTNTHTFN